MTTEQKHDIGKYIKNAVIPEGMSITEAAEKLGVTRAALSNLLSGNIPLSDKMAARIEEAFHVSAHVLLMMQQKNHTTSPETKSAIAPQVTPHIPAFLKITATQLDKWAETTDARDELPVLIRRLIHSTCSVNDIKSINFPGYDNAQRAGWDGIVEVNNGTPWVVAGRSVWEFGCNNNPRQKADSDYETRTSKTPAGEQKDNIFVFVTPRNWPAKDKWVKEKAANSDWKAIRVYDGSDLEQWLELSPATQVWLAQKIGIDAKGCKMLTTLWDEWVHSTTPRLVREVFTVPLSLHGNKIAEYLKEGASGSFRISADSCDEALAFLDCYFTQSVSMNESLGYSADKIVHVFEVDALDTLCGMNSPIIPVVSTIDMERALGSRNFQHSFVVEPRNTDERDANIILETFDNTTFIEILKSIGLTDSAKHDRWIAATGKSLTILRRQLSSNLAIQKPEWADKEEYTRPLIPMIFASAWRENNESDREILKRLAACDDYDDIERFLKVLCALDDAPVWSIDSFRGVVSSLDALTAIKQSMIRTDLERFLAVAKEVLSEIDPALELPQEERIFAPLRGKRRQYSDALRKGITNMLIILAVRGESLFSSDIATYLEREIKGLISGFLAPLTLEALESHDKELSFYAEAVPDTFLEIIESALRDKNPALEDFSAGIERESMGLAMGGCPRANLLWALEILAWNQKYFSRIVKILARLSEIKIRDNYSNSPFNTLIKLFEAAMPQTATPLEARIVALKNLMCQYPEVGWKICVNQLDWRGTAFTSSHRPIWRGDAYGHGSPVKTWKPILEFRSETFEMAIKHINGDTKKLAKMLECIDNRNDLSQNFNILDAVETWLASSPSDEYLGKIFEKLKYIAFARHGNLSQFEESMRSPLLEKIKDILPKLQPADLIERHRYLFEKNWTDLSLDDDGLEADSAGEPDNYLKQEKRLKEARKSALKEIWDAHNFEGVRRLLNLSDARADLAVSTVARDIGKYMQEMLSKNGQQSSFLENLSENEGVTIDLCIRGFLESMDDDYRMEIFKNLNELSASKKTRIFLNAPFIASTWQIVVDNGLEMRTEYWEKVIPPYLHNMAVDKNFIIERFVEHKRPQVAFSAISTSLKDTEPLVLQKLLWAMTTTESVNDVNIFRDLTRVHHLVEALKYLNDKLGVLALPDEHRTSQQAQMLGEMGNIEFALLQILLNEEDYDCPNLGKWIELHPLVFVQILAMGFKRDDDKQDPDEWVAKDDTQRKQWGEISFNFTRKFTQIPGKNPLTGKINSEKLKNWLTQALALCAEYGRARIGEETIGQMLARAARKESDNWPSDVICDVLESFQSPDIGGGFRVGIFNSRGVQTSTGWGGALDRTEANDYEMRADRVRTQYPFVASILDEMAEGFQRSAKRLDMRAQVGIRTGDITLT